MSDTKESVEDLLSEFSAEIQAISAVDLENASWEEAESALKRTEELRIRHTGKRSRLAELKKLIGRVPADERGVFGKLVQETEKQITETLDRLQHSLSSRLEGLRVERERIDVTLPGRRILRGSLHPITLLRQRIEDIFVSMGYAIEDDREIETDYYNFDALNIPEGHPARESQDTFYTTDGLALRSQTSTVQIRVMERRGVPLQIIAPGKVFRRDTPDMTHVPMFHQVEGLCVDKGITMAHLKGTVSEWLQRLFGPETVTRFRPSYFPFTEPSAEFDFSCFTCGGSGEANGDRCRPCKGSGWIELGGSGMVHPNVLRACEIDPTEYSGFAFGFGLERMAALMYNIDDIRQMFENDVRFAEQFK